VSDQCGDRILADSTRLVRGRAKALFHRDRNGIDRAAAECIVRMRLEERLPGVVRERAGVVALSRRERRPWLGVANQLALDARVPTLLVGARGERALKCPGETVRITKLAVDDRECPVGLQHDRRGERAQ